MKVSLIHPSLNNIGGSEQVCISLITALKEIGCTITLGTFEKTNWAKMKAYYGNLIIPDFEVISKRGFIPNAYGEMLNFYALSLKMPRDSEICIVSCTSPWFYPPGGRKLVVYILPPLNYERGLRRIYLEPYLLIQRVFLSRVKNKILLTNSSFSSKIITDAYSINPDILYPPVKTASFYSKKKDELIVSVGRFDPTKRHEILIEALRKTKTKTNCIIMGGIAGDSVNQSLSYIAFLKNLISKYNLNERIKLLVNCPHDLLLENLAKAKVYVHCYENEPFGISIVESMAAGCVPIVHQSGGAYYDIINKDQHGLSFCTSEELAEQIDSILTDPDFYSKLSKDCLQRAENFSDKVFRKNFVNLIAKMKQ